MGIKQRRSGVFSACRWRLCGANGWEWNVRARLNGEGTAEPGASAAEEAGTFPPPGDACSPRHKPPHAATRYNESSGPRLKPILGGDRYVVSLGAVGATAEVGEFNDPR